ncbi:MAG: hypothetical protein KatS3mg054_0006 [Chloroflexus sp.]|nr:MAG: hypothetical protein KatS3mg054_0006 [Chloroflexus sp.]
MSNDAIYNLIESAIEQANTPCGDEMLVQIIDSDELILANYIDIICDLIDHDLLSEIVWMPFDPQAENIYQSDIIIHYTPQWHTEKLTFLFDIKNTPDTLRSHIRSMMHAFYN